MEALTDVRESLPTILDIIAKSVVSLLSAPTGSGKSTLVPTYLAANNKIFVAVPTIIAVGHLASYARVLAPELAIGTAAEGDIKYDDSTMLVYATAGHIQRKLLGIVANNQSANFCTVLMIDEAHNGSVENTVIFALWKYLAQRQAVPRILLSSATLPDSLMRQIYPWPDIAPIAITSTSFAITVNYLAKDIRRSEVPGAVLDKVAESWKITTGNILIFEVGQTEVEHLVQSLRTIMGPGVDVLPAYSQLSPEQLAAIARPGGPRRIIVATNIAESSITLPELEVVIDPGYEKRAVSSASGAQRLMVSLISRNSAGQRAGRTGRVMPGICYRLISEASFQKLSEATPPEIERIPIDGVILELLASGVDPTNILAEQVSIGRINASRNRLVELSLVDANGLPNEMGLTITRFPLAPVNGAFLYRWLRTGSPPFVGITIAVLLDCLGPSYFKYPPKVEGDGEYQAKVNEHITKYYASYLGLSDIETLMNLWLAFARDMDGIQPRTGKVNKWAKDHAISAPKLREILHTINQCVNATRRLGYTVVVGAYSTNNAMTVAKPLLAETFTQRFSLSRDGRQYKNAANEWYALDRRFPRNWRSTIIIPLATIELEYSKYVTCALPV